MMITNTRNTKISSSALPSFYFPVEAALLSACGLLPNLPEQLLTLWSYQHRHHICLFLTTPSRAFLLVLCVAAAACRGTDRHRICLVAYLLSHYSPSWLLCSAPTASLPSAAQIH